MSLASVLSAATIRRFDGALDRWRLIDELAVELARAAGDLDRALVARAMIERERQLGTGLEKGLAVPHALLPAHVRPAACLALVPQGVDFDAMDRAPARLVLGLIVPDHDEGRSRHLRILAAAAGLLTRPEVAAGLLSAPDGREAHARLLRAEHHVASASRDRARG